MNKFIKDMEKILKKYLLYKRLCGSKPSKANAAVLAGKRSILVDVFGRDRILAEEIDDKIKEERKRK